jgi:hypothetical protein
MAFYGMAWSAAQILTPIIATQVISKGGYQVLWMVLAGFGMVVLIGIKRLENSLN